MGFFQGLWELIGLTLASGAFALALYLPIAPFTALIDGYLHPKAAMVLAFIVSLFLVNDLSSGVYLAALHAVVKPILIVGGIVLALGFIAALAGFGDDARRGG